MTKIRKSSLDISVLTASNVVFSGPIGNINSSNVQSAIEELDNEKASSINANLITPNIGAAVGTSLNIGTGALTAGTGTFSDTLKATKTSTTLPIVDLWYNGTSNYAQHLMDPGGNYVIKSPASNGVTSGNTFIQAGGSIYIGANNIPVASSQAIISSTGLAVTGAVSATSHIGAGATIGNWSTGTSALQVGSGTALWNPGSVTQTYLMANAIYDNTDNRFEFIGSGTAGAYAIVGNSHVWKLSTGATGAGNPCTFSDAMTLSSAGLDVTGSRIRVTNDGTTADFTTDSTDGAYLRTYSSPNTISFKKSDGVSMGVFSSTGLAVTGNISSTNSGSLNIGTGALTAGSGTFSNNLSVTGQGKFNNTLYFSSTNGNTLNSGFAAASDDSDIWINYRGYNDGQSYFRDFRVGDGKGSEIAFFDGSSKNCTIAGTLYATAKSFCIDHPLYNNKKLIHGSLEGPENGVYIRGRVTTSVIELPDYWTKLVDCDSITVQLTPIGKHQKLYVDKIVDNKIYIATENLINQSIECFYFIQAERIDIDKLEVETEE